MIKENQGVLNTINVLSDGIIIFLMLPIAFWMRFYVLPDGVISVPFIEYILTALILTILHLFTYAAFGMYRSFRGVPLVKELSRLWTASLLDIVLMLSVLFLQHSVNYSRLTLAIFFVLNIAALSLKRLLLRKSLARLRSSGYNQKNVVILGSGDMAQKYQETILREKDLGFKAVGYVAPKNAAWADGPKYLGTFDELERILERCQPDEVVSAIDIEDYRRTPQIITACEKTGTKLAIIPFYADYMPSNPQIDDVGGLPLMNIRRIPLDNWANAFFKRAIDVIGSGLLLLVTLPITLICAIGVKLSSPGPVIFKQERVGRGKKPFYMYKFRSMKVNSQEKTAWSRDRDDRKTKFGAFLRKFSLDEFPQFFNVLRGDMSLVGPRPELPHFVDQFKEEVPLYMVKHQVRPGITGWAQVNGLRGDTSIKERIEHDLYYIEHWSLLLDAKILFMTLFGGKFMNSEKLT